MRCHECGYTKWIKTDKWIVNANGISVRVWRCGRNPNHLQEGYVPFTRTKPKELYLDIETSLMQVAVFDLRVPSKYIPAEAIIKPSFIVCWAAGWVGKREIFSGIVTPLQAKRCDDSKIIKPLWDLMNDADIVIAHNGDAFDIKKINYRFFLHGYEPPEKYRTVDTLKVARKNFKAESNKMDYLSSRLGGLRKNKMEFQDWVGCMNGEPGALDKMVTYNKKDVAEGKGLYERMIKWIPVHTGQIIREEAVRA